ncbi:suppressor of kinetochore protein mutant [Tyrophagus putrescentiae]|nr:suppressor of kinetochore protein mutant [Tyrophagus putrescentiae]
MPMIKLQTSDNEIVEVDSEIACMFTTLRYLLDSLGTDEDNNEPIPVQKADSTILRKVIEWATYHKNDPPIPDDEKEKMFHLLTALPASEQIHVQGLAFKEAVEKLEERFDEVDRVRAISSVLSLVLDLSNRYEIQLEAFNCAIQLLPQPVYWAYVHTKGTRKLQDLINFMKNHIQGLCWLESAAGTNCGFTKNNLQQKPLP